MPFCFNDTATTEIYTLSLHDALPILDALLGVADDELVEDLVGRGLELELGRVRRAALELCRVAGPQAHGVGDLRPRGRSEAPTSELQSRQYLVCRLLLGKKNAMQASQ